MEKQMNEGVNPQAGESKVGEAELHAEPAGAKVDEAELQAFVRNVEASQNLSLGITGGVVGAAIGAVLWAAISYWTGYQMGYMAIGVGFLVGIGVRFLGKGITPVFGVVGALLSLLGCLAGNILTICLFISNEYSIPLAEILSKLDISMIILTIKETFQAMDVLFYALAIWAGYRFSFRRITQQEVSSLVKPKP